MTDKMTLWNNLARTNPEHTKGFQRAGGFKGTAIKPIYCDQRMTEEFGPCGTNWGIDEPRFEIVTAGEEILVYCWVSIWHGEPSHKVFGVGGDKVVTKFSSGLRASDEAFKGAFTDAVGNAYKRLGMSADIHMGLFDDNKYVNELRKEFAEGDKKLVQSEKPISATSTLPRVDPALEGASEFNPAVFVESFHGWVSNSRSQADANEVWTVNKPGLAQLKKVHPMAYAELRTWFATEKHKLPIPAI